VTDPRIAVSSTSLDVDLFVVRPGDRSGYFHCCPNAAASPHVNVSFLYACGIAVRIHVSDRKYAENFPVYYLSQSAPVFSDNHPGCFPERNRHRCSLAEHDSASVHWYNCFESQFPEISETLPLIFTTTRRGPWINGNARSVIIFTTRKSAILMGESLQARLSRRYRIPGYVRSARPGKTSSLNSRPVSSIPPFQQSAGMSCRGRAVSQAFRYGAATARANK